MSRPDVARPFISYSSLDRPIAERLCAALESAGTPCWIAPRDIVPSREWAEQIIEGINQASAMLLVFSSRSNASPQVRREVERAVHKQVPVIPFRVENVLPTKSLEYFLSAQHWLDAGERPVEDWVPTLGRLIAQFEAERRERLAGEREAATGDERAADTGFQPSAFAEWAPSRTMGLDPAPRPMGQPPSSPPSTPSHSTDSDQAPLTALLRESLGPVAQVMVRRFAQRHADPAALVEALSLELDVPAERVAFLARARKLMRLA